MPKNLKKTKGFTAWVVYWIIREDKVSKTTGTVITLLPRRYSANTIQTIVEGLYAAYAYPYAGQEHFVRKRKKSISRITFDYKVIIGENPGLIAVLAKDVIVEVDSSGINQSISWTNPDSSEPSEELPGWRKTASGKFHKYSFNYLTREQTDIA